MRRIAIVVVVVVAVLALVPVVAYRLAKYDVMQEAKTVATPGKQVEIIDTRMGFSFRHVVLVTCDLRGAEFSRIVWYLLPWRKTILEK